MVGRAVRAVSLVLGVCELAAAGDAAAAGKLNLSELPVNAWVEISREQKPAQAFCSALYVPVTDEWLIWGKIGGHRYASTRYEAETLALRDESPTWRESFPKGKEQSWSEGRFPNWGCHCHRLAAEDKAKVKGPWLETANDYWLGTSSSVNQVRFVEADGVMRPTRCPTFHHVTYDSRRGRVLFYVGGKTFAYEPRERAWADLKAKAPLCCEALAWASLCYDPVGDQAVLFGGGYALNPLGGAATWVFDCAKAEWRRPELKGGVEPPVRCNARLVYDAKNKVMVLFGGDAQSKMLGDTWVFDPAKLEWAERKPAVSPPPTDRVAACYIEKRGLVFVLTFLTEPRASRGWKAWTYDAALNEWTAVKGVLPGSVQAEWASCDYSAKDDVVVATLPGGGTYLYRLDPATAKEEGAARAGVPPGSWAWNPRSAAQMKSLLAAPPPDRKATEEKLRNLPPNTVVNSDYPGELVSKTWSTAVIDTDRGVVLYTGGGHCGWKGNDIALFDVGANRWSFDAPADFVPFIYDYNGALFGWTYGFRPTSQHTYRWYCYDPQSKTMVYCPRNLGIPDGMTIQTEEGPGKAFVYERQKHGDFTWVYEPAANRLYRPVAGRPFGNAWEMAMVGTPAGVFAKEGAKLCQGKVTLTGGGASIEWKVVDMKCPAGTGEFQPLVYDSKRERLLFVAVPPGGSAVEVYERPVAGTGWKKVETKGRTKNSREVVYDAKNDCLVSMPPQAVMVIDCATNEWKELDMAMPKGSYGTECAMVYDPVHEVCVMLVPTGFSAKMGVYLFRYDPKTARFKE